MNNSKIGFIDRKGEPIAEHSVIFGSTKNGLKEVVASYGAGMSFANQEAISQILKNGNNVLCIDAKGNNIYVPVFEGNPNKKNIISRGKTDAPDKKRY